VDRVETCRASPRRATVAVRETATDRIHVKGVTARLRVRVTVVSDYLFIGSGRFLVPWEELRRVVGAIVRATRVEQVLYHGSRVRGLRRVKEFYSVGGKPAIPGSSLKGAVRSRIELASTGDRVPAVFLYDSGALKALPEVGVHGWRHARIWCESVFEERVRKTGYTVLEDIMGVAGGGFEAIGSRVYFGDLKLISRHSYEVVVLDHNEAVQAMPRGSVFEGEILVQNLEMDELGLLFYGLAQDKRLYCNRDPLMLLGAFKYRCRVRQDTGKRVEFGVVRVDVVGVEYAPWSRVKLPLHELLRRSLGEAFNNYSLRKCFDEVERKRMIEPCRD